MHVSLSRHCFILSKSAYLLVLGLILHVHTAFGQDTETIQLTVTQLAGNNVYLDGGTNQGIAKGDTLVLQIDADKSLLVIASSRQQSIAQFANTPFPITRGEVLDLRLIKGLPPALAVTEEEPPAEALEAEAVSIMSQPEQPRTNRQTRRKSGIEVDGRLILTFSALNSETRVRSNAVPAASRTYLTPTANLNATIRNLPSGMNMRVHLRSDYRYQTRNPIAPSNSFRAYQLSLEKTLPFGAVQFGRFYNRMTQRGGYWDGLTFLVGSRKRGIGGSIGFMPDRSNEGFSTQLPRYALFAHYQTDRRKNVHYRGAISFNEIQPNNELLNHRYASLEQRIDISVLSLRQDIQVDYHPISQQWIVSHLRLGGRISLGRDVRVNGTYTIRQPYRIANIINPFMSRTDQYRAGISLSRPKFSLGGNYSRRLLNQAYVGQTFSAYFNTRPITPLALSFSGSASRWESNFGEALYLNAGLARNIKKVYLRADYGFYRSTSPNVDRHIDMHRVTLTTSVPFSRRFYWTTRASAQQSQFSKALSLQTSLQIRF